MTPRYTGTVARLEAGSGATPLLPGTFGVRGVWGQGDTGDIPTPAPCRDSTRMGQAWGREGPGDTATPR